MFKSALEINEKFFKARVNLAQILMLMGDDTEAVKELETAKQFCPNFYRTELNDLIQAVRIKSSEDELAVFFHNITEEQPSSSQISRELAIEYIQNGHNTEAIRELKKSISFQPDYPDLHNYLGIAYGNSGMVDDSIEEFETALKINPYYIKARLNLALVMYENGRYPEARSNIDAVLNVQPENQLANNLLKELETIGERK
jgi:Tfp pilus assembly protein PilF